MGHTQPFSNVSSLKKKEKEKKTDFLYLECRPIVHLLKFCESDALTLIPKLMTMAISKSEKVNIAHINPSKEMAADFVGKQFLIMEYEVVFAGLIS